MIKGQRGGLTEAQIFNGPPVNVNPLTKLEIDKEEDDRLKKAYDHLKKVYGDDAHITLNLDAVKTDIVLYDEFVTVMAIPEAVYAGIQSSVSKACKKKGIYLKTYKSQGMVEVESNERDSDQCKQLLKEFIRCYLKGHVVDVSNLQKETKYEDFPDMADIKNYPKETRALCMNAISGFKKSKTFKVLMVGNPGTGKTWFAKILSKELLSKNNVDTVIYGEPRKVQFYLNLMDKLEIDLHILFILDEMEEIITDREYGSNGQSGLLTILDGIGSHDRFSFLGMSNIPQTMDKAVFRPGRIDVLIKMQQNDVHGLDYIMGIFNSMDHDFPKEEMTQLAQKSQKVFKERMPISFYAHMLKLHKIYKKIDIVFRLLDVFYKNKDLFTYKDGFVNDDEKVGFGAK